MVAAKGLVVALAVMFVLCLFIADVESRRGKNWRRKIRKWKHDRSEADENSQSHDSDSPSSESESDECECPTLPPSPTPTPTMPDTTVTPTPTQPDPTPTPTCEPACGENMFCFAPDDCQCNPGFELIGGICIDINECIKFPDICPPGEECLNVPPGGHTCSPLGADAVASKKKRGKKGGKKGKKGRKGRGQKING